MAEKAYMAPNPPSAFKAILFDADLCTACLECVKVCKQGSYSYGRGKLNENQALQ